MGSRLENFFWRIWGNKAVRDRIRGRHVAALFSNISEGGFIRTTPTQSPRNSRSIGNFRSSVPDRSPTTSPPFTLGPSDSGPSLSDEDQNDSGQSIASIEDSSPTLIAPVSASQEKKGAATLPPILKKPSAGSAIKLNKSARILSPSPTETRFGRASSSQLGSQLAANTSSIDLSKRGPGTIRFDEKTRSPSVKASSSTSQATEKTTELSDQPIQKSTRKKATFIVGAGPSKKRPVAVRQRSSQSSSSAASSVASSVTSPPPPATNLASQRRTTGSSLSPRASGQNRSAPAKNSRSSGPHPTYQEVKTRDDSPSGESTESFSSKAGGEVSDDGKRAGNRSPLVDPNFRSKFVDKTQPQQRSFASLSSLAPKSTAVAAAPASYQAVGMLGFGLPGPQAGTSKNTAELPEEATLAPADDGRGMNRTRSQLTLLLGKDGRPSEERKRQNEGGRRRRTPP